jgi:transposase
MDEEMKKRVGVFRYGLISDFVNGRTFGWGEVDRLMREKCAQQWEIPGSMRTSVSESTLKEWIQRYQHSGGKLESLYPQDRSDKGKSRAISEEVASGIVRLRKELPNTPLPALLEEARSRKIIIPSEEFSYSALYRFLKQEGLVHGPESAPQDRRRFEAPFPNDLWQSDVLHGPHVPVEGRLRKTYLIAFLDDHSRLAAYGEFYVHERQENFQDALRKALLCRGLPRKLYVDSGAAQRSTHLAYACASLGIVLVHAKPYQPEGKGNGKSGIMESWLS